MRPLKFWLLPALLAGAACILSAQEEEDGEDPPPITTDWTRTASAHSRGDQTFNISLGLVIPLLYVDESQGYRETKMNLGGMGSLGYNYFLSPGFFLGGELAGMFAATVGENMYFIVPIGFRAGYQFALGPFEFPLSLLAGIAPQSRNDSSYFGFFAKPTAAVFFRFHSDWSIGVNGSFWWVPQWTDKERAGHGGTVNIHGFFTEITLGVRYHF